MKLSVGLISFFIAGSLTAAEFHVSIHGDEAGQGSRSNPFNTISKAAEIAQPGDTITVQAGVYRERINPPRGGTSDDKRIVYQAAPGEKVTIKGSERIKGWQNLGEDLWKVTLSNRFFGDFNPYNDLIEGDWYQARQPYHTGAVYLNGHWLKEASRKGVVTGAGAAAEESARDLLTVRVLQPKGGGRVLAAEFTSKGSEADVWQAGPAKGAVGPLKAGNWLAFEDVDFGEGTDKLNLLTASPIGGGVVEIRLGTPDGELLGRAHTGLTAEWTHFQNFEGTLTRKLSGTHTLVLVIREHPMPATLGAEGPSYWFAEVDAVTTTIWAQFKGVDPNEAFVEINVRKTVFYSEEPGRDYITVRGFTLEQAATPWSPPTAEQVGLIGTHWSKGWIIENNTIQYSVCSGVTLGKHGDEFDNTYNYNRSIRLGLKNGWNRETIGGHLVRNNHIQKCGQGGIIGSLGCAFSTITGNEIHDIRQDHEYGGCETAGIKLHGAIDVLISGNHVYRCEHWGGIWLDWMGQGARVTGNFLHDNSNDLMVEMNHGPMLIDNNILLSARGVLDASGGGAYVHNLYGGIQSIWASLAKRRTPFFEPHSTDVIVDLPQAGREFGARDGAVALFSAPVDNTEQDKIYQSVRYNTQGYRLEVPNGMYTVTLKFNEPHHETAGMRRFGASVQGVVVVEALDLVARVGQNHAFDVVTEQVRVVDGGLDVGLLNDLAAPCIAGIEVIEFQETTQGGEAPFTLRINCGGPAWEGFLADFEMRPAEQSLPVLEQELTARIGVTVDQHDDRFFNNLYVKAKALSVYDEHHFKIEAAGNVFLAGAKPSTRDQQSIVEDSFDPGMKLLQKEDGWWLEMKVDPAWRTLQKRSLVTSTTLGVASVPNAPFEQREGIPYRIDTDYFGDKRDVSNPAPGPFRADRAGTVSIKVWPRN